MRRSNGHGKRIHPGFSGKPLRLVGIGIENFTVPPFRAPLCHANRSQFGFYRDVNLVGNGGDFTRQRNILFKWQA